MCSMYLLLYDCQTTDICTHLYSRGIKRQRACVSAGYSQNTAYTVHNLTATLSYTRQLTQCTKRLGLILEWGELSSSRHSEPVGQSTRLLLRPDRVAARPPAAARGVTAVRCARCSPSYARSAESARCIGPLCVDPEPQLHGREARSALAGRMSWPPSTHSVHRFDEAAKRSSRRRARPCCYLIRAMGSTVPAPPLNPSSLGRRPTRRRCSA